MKSTTNRNRNNKNVEGFAFAKQYLNMNGYTTVCPYCKQKIILTQLTSDDKDKLNQKEIIDYHCFMCDKDFKLKLK